MHHNGAFYIMRMCGFQKDMPRLSSSLMS